ncbi:MAG: hypothetical protein OXH46_15240 [Gemmatimonadetes bacterium]|nr:hypothetical protein [Gemmatimonadota bacterium]
MMWTSNILSRVFWLRVTGAADGAEEGEPANYGTGFTIGLDGFSCLVTAKHLFEDIGTVQEVAWLYPGGWRSNDVNSFEYALHRSEDVAVVVSGADIVRKYLGAFNIDDKRFYDGGGFSLGQEVGFCGFPYTRHAPISVDMSKIGIPEDRLVPFVRQGIISAVEPIVVDAVASKGFSRGPVVVYDNKLNGPKVIGVVSGYDNIVTAPDKAPFTFCANIGHAVELIEALTRRIGG